MAKGLVERFVDSQAAWLDQVADAIQPAINQAFSSGGEAGHYVKDFLNGVWLGHPLHPVITDVPIGAWTIAQLLDLISAARGDDPGLDTASDIALGAGIVAAVGAAVTGITDWSDVGGAHRRMGLLHGLTNAVGLTFNLGSMALRMSGGNRAAARVLSATGYVTSAAAAYIAGELVYNLGMAVSRNAWTEGPERYKDVATFDELAEGRMHKVDVDGTPVVLVRDEHGIHAFSGICSHYGCGLWEGTLEGHIVTCQCHGSQYDISDGSLVHGPATDSVPSYEARKWGESVQVRLSE